MSWKLLIVLYCIINVATRFNQLRGHIQATRVYTTRIATADFILCHNDVAICCTIHK
jgi:hypothetical protein